MPEVSRFFGVSIRMYFDDHNPPHFHAVYGDAEAELLANWELMRNDQSPNPIDPLDQEPPECFPVYVAFDTSKTTDSNWLFRTIRLQNLIFVAGLRGAEALSEHSRIWTSFVR
jgi:hypothetical protein